MGINLQVFQLQLTDNAVTNVINNDSFLIKLVFIFVINEYDGSPGTTTLCTGLIAFEQITLILLEGITGTALSPCTNLIPVRSNHNISRASQNRDVHCM